MYLRNDYKEYIEGTKVFIYLCDFCDGLFTSSQPYSGNFTVISVIRRGFYAATYMRQRRQRVSLASVPTKSFLRRVALLVISSLFLCLSSFVLFRSRRSLKHNELKADRRADAQPWHTRSRTSLRQTKRHGKGIYFFTYGSNRTFHHFETMVIEAAVSFRKHSPGLPLAIATSQDSERFDGLFDYKILIREDHDFAGTNYQKRPDNLSRQWLTRILYLTATPFEVTIAYDANVINCKDILPSLNRLAHDDFDFAAATSSSRSSSAKDIFPHNFALAFKWNRVVASFFDAWFMEQVSAGVSMDDQHTLIRAARTFRMSHSSFRFRPLDPAIAAAFASTEPKLGFFPRETRVLTGAVSVIHVEHTYSTRAGELCQIFNTVPLSRQIVFTKREEFTVALSGDECIRALAEFNSVSCRYINLWSREGIQDLLPSAS